MGQPVLVDGVRTPFLKVGTVQKTATDFGVAVVNELQRRYPDLNRSVDCVVGGNIGNQVFYKDYSRKDASNIARVIALQAGIPKEVPAWTVNNNCASGLHAPRDVALAIYAEEFDCGVAVGVEDMSDYPAIYPREQRNLFAEFGRALKKKELFKISKLYLKGNLFMPHKPIWALETGLTDPIAKLKMDQISDGLAKEFGLSRDHLDQFGLESQRRASAAQRSGRFAKEIVEFDGQKHDNGVRHGQTMAQLAKLPPNYPGGVTTPGNSSQLTDGAVALLIADEAYARAMGWPILARLYPKWWAAAGCEPERMGVGPVAAIAKLIKKTGLKLSNFGLIETNEAFAAVVLSQLAILTSKEKCAELGIGEPMGDFNEAMDKVNVNGGAIALGHPLGASGARLLLTLALEMKLRNVRLGLATLCVGGGQGEAMVIERV